MLFIGATTAFFTGLIGIVQNDIKRVVAYSTLSQLGYMTVALGVSAYSAAIFHLMTHAFFKALLFLGAGSVIIGMHHEQDMRHMGGLRKYMPITFWTMLIGTLALVGTPFFSGFYSKDTIIEAAAHHAARGAQLGRDVRLLGGAAGRVRDRVLQLPPAVPDLPRQGALPRSGARPLRRAGSGFDRARRRAGAHGHDACSTTTATATTMRTRRTSRRGW